MSLLLGSLLSYRGDIEFPCLQDAVVSSSPHNYYNNLESLEAVHNSSHLILTKLKQDRYPSVPQMGKLILQDLVFISFISFC